MSKILRAASAPWLHPLLFAAFPVVFLWSHNVDQGVKASQALGALAICVGMALAIFLCLRLFLHDSSRAAGAASAIVLILLTLGRVELRFRVVAGSVPEHLLLLSSLLFTAAAIVAVHKFRPHPTFTRTLNTIAGFLVVLNVAPILLSSPSAAAEDFRYPAVRGLEADASGVPRDVYYLIFDRYAGERTLSQLYDFDDSALFDWLSAHGFVMPSDAWANYPQTSHSLGSSLNMNYLDGIAKVEGVGSSAWSPIVDLLKDSAVARTFQAMGYKYDLIGSWWHGSDFDPRADQNFTYGRYNEFSGGLLRTTALPAIARLLGIGPSVDFDKQGWERVHFQVHALSEVAADAAPTFTFAHFLVPHPPYVFHADGSFVPSDPNRPVEEAYIDQLRYTNRVIEQVVTELQRAPGPAPIIVVQSDEGPHPPSIDQTGEILTMPWSKASDVDLERKLRILNAYYLPGNPPIDVPPSITPVNTFRLILDDYFGGTLSLLPDRTYVFTDYSHPYRFEDVTGRLRRSDVNRG